MVTQVVQDSQNFEMSGNKSFVSTLPQGSTIQQIAFVTERGADQELLLEFPYPLQRQAVLVKCDLDQALTAGDLSILAIPVANREVNLEFESELLSRMREWVGAETRPDSSPSLVMTLQGAQIVWAQGRLAILAQPERLDAIRKALIEVSYLETELRDIERTLCECWPQLEADMPLAFEFNASSIRKRRQLRQRFQQVHLIRTRLARIGPYVHCPHLHPPTLASQVAERLRERTRMIHKHDYLGDQVAVFERVYEMCAQRASDFKLARAGHTLEWVIIIILLTQCLFWGFEIFSNMSR